MVGFNAVVSLFALAAPLVAGHGIISNPLAEFTPNVMRTTYVTRIQANFPGKFDDSPQTNVANFNKAFKAQTQFKTLRDMLDPQGPDCGNTLTNGAKKAIPTNGMMTWQNPDTGEGFIPSHTGPCEVWIDNKRVFQNDDCATNFPAKPAANLPVDYSSCGANGCMLRFYWLALHEPMWQVYKNCVPLKGNGQQPTSAPKPTAKPVNPTPKPVNPTPKPVNPTTKPTTKPMSKPSGTVAVWGQCGGKDYNGATACVSGTRCEKQNDYYYQCRPASESTEIDDDEEVESDEDEDYSRRLLRRA
ncbi:hypothetical protein SPRG_22161 [Saprolegnia parasitica CBS 223.65]|uniref:CBM1 domain-containing protein n=1 Tax=Saprolegnia parasitica (strain CBS 223.65) TaxID=695850 RepID=A0A067CFK2_SAPPC|nr:hypothetical protein SPRG_22161 [Saprolegnia parasitica CBS 223.65]KDO29253.1 hypothetical protein SPRG_22161 [Saprolegnia parasitica CBS 223.65]|eukprot:XP_012200155.1 hypothetical protein SPRG_22161 [Saprolegnia parasitica CBS 223.65]